MNKPQSVIEGIQKRISAMGADHNRRATIVNQINREGGIEAFVAETNRMQGRIDEANFILTGLQQERKALEEAIENTAEVVELPNGVEPPKLDADEEESEDEDEAEEVDPAPAKIETGRPSKKKKKGKGKK